MPGIEKNEKLEVSEQGNLDTLRFRYRYDDPDQNSWIVTIIGDPDLVKEFDIQRSLELRTKTLVPDEVDSINRRWIAEDTANTDQPDQEEEEPDLSDGQLPGLNVIIQLVALKNEGQPYLVSFGIDPTLTARKPTYSTTVQLQGKDTSANVRCDPPANGGTVSLTLSRRSTTKTRGPGTAPAVVIAPVAAGTTWHVLVRRASGNPTFTLRGDIVVN